MPVKATPSTTMNTTTSSSERPRARALVDIAGLRLHPRRADDERRAGAWLAERIERESERAQRHAGRSGELVRARRREVRHAVGKRAGIGGRIAELDAVRRDENP